MHPEILDENHPRLAPGLEILQPVRFDTDDTHAVTSAIRAAYEQIAVRADPSLAWIGNRVPAKAVAVIGRSHVGKSTAVEDSMKVLPTLIAGCGTAIAPAIIQIKAPAIATTRALVQKLLVKSGYKTTRTLPADDAFVRFDGRQAVKQFTAIAFDDVERIIDPQKPTATVFVINLIANILDHDIAPATVVLCGHPDMLKILNADTERAQALRNRLDVVEVKRMTNLDSELVMHSIKHYADLLGVEVATEPDLPMRLIHASGYAYGGALKLARLAVVRASIATKVLKSEDFAGAYAAKTGCSGPANPFAAAGWRDIDPTLLLARLALDRRSEEE